MANYLALATMLFAWLAFSTSAARAESIKAHGARRETNFLVYLPPGTNNLGKYPCLVGFSPNGHGERVLNFLKAACDQYHWILLAPENTGAAVPFLALDPMMQDMVDTALKRYPIDAHKMYSCGFAGGAMEAHHLSVLCPDKIQGVIANCGIIHAAGLQEPEYPTGKLAVFLASQGDRRYVQMKENAEFLKSRKWTTDWIEFDGGHNWAPADVYTKAVGWLDQQTKAKSPPSINY